MNYEDKRLLIVDLCGRTPFNVKVKIHSSDVRTVRGVDVADGIVHFVESDSRSPFGLYIEDPLSFRQSVKPYLRSLSNMTEDEARELASLCGIADIDILRIEVKQEFLEIEVDDGVASGEIRTIWFNEIVTSIQVLDWLNAHQFDYRGLIPKRLALEMPEHMYKNK